MPRSPRVRDFAPETQNFAEEVLDGLRKPVRELPCKYFYDERGSDLFEEITRLEEYYPTRTEVGILRENIDEVVACVGSEAMLIEYGSGSSRKTTILLDHLPDLAAYVPIDISSEHLAESARRIANRYPRLDVLPVAADYNDSSFKIPSTANHVSHRVVYYPGSTIGNFHPADAVAFLARIRNVVGTGGGLVLGVDLKKDPAVLHRAYNDSAGVTAEFNLNILRRINRELDGDFRLDRWRHRAIYNGEAGRIELHLVSLEDQEVQVDGETFEFDAGETIWTESSYKYSVDEFAEIAGKAGFDVTSVWTDADDLFSVQYLTSRRSGDS
jgi:dimethylhistidine N-methyltransferase